jgi:hypothetical protein
MTNMQMICYQRDLRSNVSSCPWHSKLRLVWKNMTLTLHLYFESSRWKANIILHQSQQSPACLAAERILGWFIQNMYQHVLRQKEFSGDSFKTCTSMSCDRKNSRLIHSKHVPECLATERILGWFIQNMYQHVLRQKEFSGESFKTCTSMSCDIKNSRWFFQNMYQHVLRQKEFSGDSFSKPPIAKSVTTRTANADHWCWPL